MENFYFYFMFAVPFFIEIMETVSSVFIILKIEKGVKKHIRYKSEMEGFIFEKKALEKREKNNWQEFFSLSGLSILKNQELNFTCSMFSIASVILPALFLFLKIEAFDYILAISIVAIFLKTLLSNQAEIKFSKLKDGEPKPQLKIFYPNKKTG